MVGLHQKCVQPSLAFSHTNYINTRHTIYSSFAQRGKASSGENISLAEWQLSRNLNFARMPAEVYALPIRQNIDKIGAWL